MFIREEILEALGLSVTQAADMLGVPPTVVSDLIQEQAALSLEMALRIEKVFDINVDLLLRLQAWHAVWLARQKIDAERCEPV
jgi:addiction module HigA family antidote